MLEPVSAAERAEFEEWHADPERARAYAEIARLATLAESLPRPSSRAHTRPTDRLAFRPLLAASLVALVLALGLVFATVRGGGAAEAALTNPGPATRLVRLEDGSTVALDTGTRLTLSFSRSDRVATLLAGRARFNVERGPRPFLVSLGGARAVVDQGRLDASLNAAGAAIAVLDGKAQLVLVSNASSILLAPGDAVTIVDTSLQRVPFNTEDRLWPLARVGFDKAPLSRVVEQANRAGDVPIRLGPDLDALPVSGVLDIRDTRKLAPKLATALNLNLVEREGYLLLSR